MAYQNDNKILKQFSKNISKNANLLNELRVYGTHNPMTFQRNDFTLATLNIHGYTTYIK